MPNMAGALVVDTSVLVKWIRSEGEELLVEARALRSRVDQTGAQLYAPALLVYELGNILIRKTVLPPEDIADVLDKAVHSRLVLVPPGQELASRAARVARQYDVTFYDAAFVALAELLHCPLVTADRYLAEQTRGSGFVRYLVNAKEIP
jgi:predicted nucleic acid-binding protein